MRAAPLFGCNFDDDCLCIFRRHTFVLLLRFVPFMLAATRLPRRRFRTWGDKRFDMPVIPSNRRNRSGKNGRKQSRRENGGDENGGGFVRAVMKFFLKMGVLALIWGGVVLAAIVVWCMADMPDISQVTHPQRRPTITILADDGSVVTRRGDSSGKYLDLGSIPEDLRNAVMAIEDRRFYSHFGVDVFGVARASFRNMRAGRLVEGGSTITQQLAKNIFLSPQRTFKRKVQEVLLALWLERTYSKDQIFASYLNRVYFGAGAYGADAAAKTYFGKPVAEINLRESAILAGLLRAPSRFSPANDPAQSLARARVVLAAMVDAGYIADAERENALAAVPPPRRKPGAAGDGRHFADWIADNAGALMGDDPKDIVVETTLDMKLQRAAERRVDAALAGAGSMKAEEAALVTLAPDGAVRAMVGGRDYEDSQFNRATQAMRQPGSAFKPIIYLAALSHGMSPNEVFEDSKITIGKWSPENYDGKYRGAITAREALAESINTVAVQVLQRVGVDAAIASARGLGIASPMEKNLSLALGTNTLTPLELTGAYASLAAGGRGVVPYAIKEIRDGEGEVLYRRQEITAPATADPAAVAALVEMMGEVMRSGTGKRAALDRPAAGKTGTSSDYRDAWFVGFTADYITGVWIGNDDNHPMKKVTGGSLPAELWHDFMVEAEAPFPPRDLPALAASPPLGDGIPAGADALGDLIKGLTGLGEER